jgi:hypothetical protein
MTLPHFKSPWSAHYPDRWLPNDGPDGKPDPRWREHGESGVMPCPPDMMVQYIADDQRYARWFKADVREADYWRWKWVDAWRPGEPNVWHIERGDVGEVDVDYIKQGDIKHGLAWDKTPQGPDYWLARWQSPSLMTDCDRAFIAAVIAAHDEPASADAPDRDLGGRHFSLKETADGTRSVLCNGRDTGLIVGYQPYRGDWAFLLGGSDERELIAADTLAEMEHKLERLYTAFIGPEGDGK